MRKPLFFLSILVFAPFTIVFASTNFEHHMDNVWDLIQHDQKLEAVFYITKVLEKNNISVTEKVRYLHNRALLALQTNNKKLFEDDFATIESLCENFSDCYAIYLTLTPQLHKYYYQLEEKESSD